MSDKGEPIVRVLDDRLCVSTGKAVCRIGPHSKPHPIPAGQVYHKVVELVDGEFACWTMCPEHDIFADSPEQARWIAELFLAHRRPIQGMDSAELAHSLSRFGPKPVRALVKRKVYRVRSVVLSKDGQTVDLELE